MQEALQIAMQGLRLEPSNEHFYVTFEFATWTRNLAEGLGDRAAALEASLLGFKAKPSLQDYQTIADLSGEDWPETKSQLLQLLRHMSPWHEADAQIDILLHENLVNDAVKKVSDVQFSSYRDRLILRVMDAAIASHSQWVIENAISRAQAIMDAGKAKYYSTAVEWLKRAKAAYLAFEQEEDWVCYRQQLANIHGRKRKLMGLFEQNRL